MTLGSEGTLSCFTRPAPFPFSLCLEWAYGVGRVTHHVQGQTFPYWSRVSCVFPSSRLSLLCVMSSALRLPFWKQPPGTFLSPSDYAQSSRPALQKTQRIHVSLEKREREIRLKSPLVFPQPRILGGLRAWAESIDSPPPRKKQ